VPPQLSGGQQHKYSTKARQADRANEQSVCSLMFMIFSIKFGNDKHTKFISSYFEHKEKKK
jgi:hypothetical protein